MQASSPPDPNKAVCLRPGLRQGDGAIGAGSSEIDLVNCILAAEQSSTNGAASKGSAPSRSGMNVVRTCSMSGRPSAPRVIIRVLDDGASETTRFIPTVNGGCLH
jgi:hypothetical protein